MFHLKHRFPNSTNEITWKRQSNKVMITKAFDDLTECQKGRTTILIGWHVCQVLKVFLEKLKVIKQIANKDW